MLKSKYDTHSLSFENNNNDDDNDDDERNSIYIKFDTLSFGIEGKSFLTNLQ